MDQDKIEEGMLLAHEGVLQNRINNQVILQLLVEKGILTIDDVEEKRDYISKQSLYLKSMNAIFSLQRKNEEGQKFSKELETFLKSEGKEGNFDYIQKCLEK